VVLEWWQNGQQPGKCFTTIGNWRQTGKDVEWNGKIYIWSKHHEFLKFIEVPGRVGACLELALSSSMATIKAGVPRLARCRSGCVV
jgi:hypothetical protein